MKNNYANNIGILISGRGTNMENIIKACEKDSIPGKVAIVISDNPSAAGIEIAQLHAVPTKIIERKSFSSKEEFESEIIKCLNEHQANLVCLAGFMRILSPVFIRAFSSKIINIHPALLPSFPGLHAQKQALDYGVKIAGATVHFVDEGVDTGPIIIQQIVTIDENDTEESLSQKILEKEHQIYPEAIRLFFEGKLAIEGRKVKISK
ncbi:MAG: phosphoribosylglycinamide formyltransferase [Candidatus Fischerbacteria bacterium RBG_13_37_8]|uniref:Phosphoribosylglycinamide formyltransferase n=1 Tax=Candidatus Fischerbacteria bacterium RBG_13_37_8 TaxID=1817863 RepID=A0A1F5V5P4_9BACT|nr:MAG: phosphoribosylglycinamide formyltransferase [Candidatus Fischerbacteria bacterium RBG_13_37_8]